jgi:hypothetical protein
MSDFQGRREAIEFVDQHFLDRKTCVGNWPPRSPNFTLFDVYDLGLHERSDLIAIITKACVLLL